MYQKMILFTLLLGMASMAEAQNPKLKTKVSPTKPKLPENQVPNTVVTGPFTVAYTPTVIEHLAPKTKVRGDDNFNNKKVYVTVNMNYQYNRRAGDSVVKLIITLSGEEDEAERAGEQRSLFEGRWEKIVYRAPAGHRIKNVTGEHAAYFSFNADPTRPGTSLRVGTCKGYYFSLSANTLGFEFDERIIQDIQIGTHFSGADFNPDPNFRGCQFEITKLQLKPMSITLEKM